MKGFHQSKGLRLRYSYYALVIKHKALREAGLFCLPWVPYNHEFSFLRVRAESVNSHPFKKI